MSSSEAVRFGIVGGGWVSDVHARALRVARGAELWAIADYARPREHGRHGRGRELALKHGVARYFEDHRRMLEDPQLEVVLVCLPNHLHAEVTLAALAAGKHAMIEKPLCFTLAEAEAIERLAQETKRRVGYAEELCFCPKFLRARELVRQGVLGELFFLKQVEAHAGPYSDWFFDPLLAGGGALMDMGCHSIELARWMFDKKPVRRVTAQMATYLHGERRTTHGALEDHVIVHLELEGGASALLESGWALHGGMESTARLQGTRGLLDVDLLQGSGLDLFSLDGSLTESLLPGWSKPDFEWLWQNGYAQELEEMARAVRDDRVPSESAADGRAVLEIVWAAYASAASGRTVDLPFAPDPRWRFPAEPYLQSREGR